MSEMLDRVAWAIELARLDGDIFGGRKVARVALKAMREPTRAMKEAYWGLLPDGVESDCPHPAVVFRAMIDAALAE